MEIGEGVETGCTWRISVVVDGDYNGFAFSLGRKSAVVFLSRLDTIPIEL